MTEVYWTTPTGFAIFCDDIRHEVSGKVSLVGVYNGVMYFVSPFPAFVPKIGVRIVYVESPGESNESVQLRLVLRQESGETVLHSFDIPASERDKGAVPNISQGTKAFLTITRHVELSPLVVTSPCMISARAYRGDLEVRLGALSLMHHPQFVQPVPSPAPPST